MQYIRENYWPTRAEDSYDLNVAATRLLLNLLPGLEMSVVFESVSKMLFHSFFFF